MDFGPMRPFIFLVLVCAICAVLGALVGGMFAAAILSLWGEP